MLQPLALKYFDWMTKKNVPKKLKVQWHEVWSLLSNVDIDGKEPPSGEEARAFWGKQLRLQARPTDYSDDSTIPPTAVNQFFLRFCRTSNKPEQPPDVW